MYKEYTITYKIQHIIHLYSDLLLQHRVLMITPCALDEGRPPIGSILFVIDIFGFPDVSHFPHTLQVDIFHLLYFLNSLTCI